MYISKSSTNLSHTFTFAIQVSTQYMRQISCLKLMECQTYNKEVTGSSLSLIAIKWLQLGWVIVCR